MRLVGIDLETTGFDTGNDRITEIGVVLWDAETKSPLLIQSAFLWDDGIKEKCANADTAAMMRRVCGITPEMLQEFGTAPKGCLEWLEKFCIKHQVDYLVAHNGENFDKPLLLAELTRHAVEAPTLRALPWLDTRTDIPFEVEPDSRKLKHLALDVGMINHFPHRAVTDVLTMLKVLSHYDLEKVIAYSKIPFVTVRALVEYADREKAKARRYSWEKLGDKTYPKCWVKRIKQDQLEKEKQESPFKIGVLQER